MTPRKRRCARIALKWIELLQRFALGKGVDTDTMMRRTFKVGGRVGLKSGGVSGTDVATIREILPGGMYVTLFCCVRTERNGRAALPCTTSKWSRTARRSRRLDRLLRRRARLLSRFENLNGCKCSAGGAHR